MYYTNAGRAGGGDREGTWGVCVIYAGFFYKPKTALRNRVLLGQ
jgi:hypothetical protein